MKLIVSALILCLGLVPRSICQNVLADSRKLVDISATPLNGEYVGMDEIKNYEVGKRWFHENRLFVRNNEAILDKVPVVFAKGKKGYSASDGGFITYRGRFFEQAGQIFVSLRPFESMYIAFPIGGCEPYSKVTVFPVRLASGGIDIDGVHYKSNSFSKQIRQQLQLMLNNERMEYTGARPYRSDLKAPSCQ